jgi:hypothetical protein
MGSFFNMTFFFNKNMKPLHIVMLFKSIWIVRFSTLCLKDIKYVYYVQQFNNYEIFFILLVLTIFLNMIILVS